MLGAVLGDILGQPYEGILFVSEPFELIRDDCDFSDDTVLTCAISDHLVNGRAVDDALRGWACDYPGRHYGGWFASWVDRPGAAANNSNGNGAAMRISPFALVRRDPNELESVVKASVITTHNNDESIRGATSLALAIRSALEYGTKAAVYSAVRAHSYQLDRSIEDYQRHQVFELKCDDTVPKAITAALSADCYEQAIRNAVLIGGDVDTIACMAGGIAEALYGIPPSLGEFGWSKLDETMKANLQALYRDAGYDSISFDGIELDALQEQERLAAEPLLKKVFRVITQRGQHG